jgi:hypothetical protein
MGLLPNNAPRPRPKAGFAMRPECRRAGELSIQSTSRWYVQAKPGMPPKARNGACLGHEMFGQRRSYLRLVILNAIVLLYG